jgi:hypothetical protein
MSYCVKCRMMTMDKSGSEHGYTTTNNRKMVKSVCNVCGCKKSRFEKSATTTGMGMRKGKQGKGAIGSLLGSVLGTILPF